MARSDACGKRKDVAETDEYQLLNDQLQARALDLEIQCREMRETVAELEESRDYYAELYYFALEGFVTFDGKGCISEINLAGASLLGLERSRLLGMPMAGFVDKDSCKPFFDHLRSCRLTGKKMITELTLTPKNAAVIRAQIISMPMPGADGYGSQYRSIIADITARRRMEEELSRMERLKLIGEMAAGIAHEIRNPMTTVRGFLQSFMPRKEFTPLQVQLNLMISELDRANSIITEYLSLAGNKAINQSLNSLNNIVENLLPLMQADALLHKKGIVTQLAADSPALFLDNQEIRQLILNLVRNGLEAMSPGGQLTIGTIAERKQVVLFVQDQGTGIPPEVRQKLGTPFLTTKETGTGLGVAICYSIAHRHQAQIDIETGDSGTTFLIKFPRQ